MTAGGRTLDASTDVSMDGILRSCAELLQPMVRIGVTGHRDLADPDAARRGVTDALCRVLGVLDAAQRHRVLASLGGISPVVLGYQIVSPLAEGADRVVAELILSDDPRLVTRARELVVPLPFPLEYYRGSQGKPGSDCPSPESQEEFDRLQARAFWTRPLHALDPVNHEQVDTGYRDVGKFVVEHCDLLFALWNGQDNALEGGTASVVRIAVQGGIPVVWIPAARASEPDHAAPVQFATGTRLLFPGHKASEPAQSADDLGAAVATSTDLTSVAAASVLTGRRKGQQSVQDLLLERIARLGELQRCLAKDPKPRRDLAAQLAAEQGGDGLVQDALAAVSVIDAGYAFADALARRYQRLLKILTVGVYAAAATAVGLGAFGSILFPFGGAWRLSVVFEAVVLVAFLSVQWLDVRKICRDRWVSFRAMSEYLRIGRYLALVTPKSSTGLDFSRVVRVTSWSSEPSLTPWFAPVLERIWDHRPDVSVSDEDTQRLRDYIVSDWIDGQIRYHERRRDDHRFWARNLRWAISGTLVATVLTVALHALREYFPHFLGKETGRDAISAALAFLVIMLTSVAAAFNGYAGQQRHSYHEARFRRMARELAIIRKRLDQARTVAELRADISEVRRVTLGEATDWFEDMRDQQLDAPT